ncbi:MAG: YfgM family protein [Syntrophobacteraceae bacterium]
MVSEFGIIPEDNTYEEFLLGAKRIRQVAKKPPKGLVLPPDTASEQLREWINKNFSVLVVAGAAMLFMISVIWGYTMYDQSKQSRAQSEYTAIAARLPAEGKVAPGDWQALIPELQKFVSEHSGTAPALNARIELAKAYFETKLYDDAVKVASEALNSAPKGHFLRPLIHYQLAYAYEAAGKTDQAINEWTSLKSLGVGDLEREADWNLGRLYAGKKDGAKAAEMYQLALKAPGDYPPAALIDQELAQVKPRADQPAK